MKSETKILRLNVGIETRVCYSKVRLSYLVIWVAHILRLQPQEVLLPVLLIRWTTYLVHERVVVLSGRLQSSDFVFVQNGRRLLQIHFC